MILLTRTTKVNVARTRQIFNSTNFQILLKIYLLSIHSFEYTQNKFE